MLNSISWDKPTSLWTGLTDSAGENKKIQAGSDQAAWKLNIHFKYTARDKSQQNHLGELGYTKIQSKSNEESCQSKLRVFIVVIKEVEGKNL